MNSSKSNTTTTTEKSSTSELPYVWLEAFTHHPAYPGLWLPYGSGHWRFKEFYDIRLKDGTEHTHMYPNGESFGGKQGSFKDEDIAEIRLIPNSENPWRLKNGLLEQSYTAIRALEMFRPEAFPEVIKHPDGRIEFKPKLYRFFTDGVVGWDGEYTRCLWEGELTLEEAKNEEVDAGRRPEVGTENPAGTD